MKYTEHNGTYVVRLMPGEELIESLTQFCQEHDITGGSIQGLGAGTDIELAHFSVPKKQYTTKEFAGEYEITNLTGNISKQKIHIHMTIGDEEFHSYAGHCNRAVADPTIEVTIYTGQEMQRVADEYSGLALLDLPKVLMPALVSEAAE